MPDINDTFKLGPGGSYRLIAPIGKSSFGEIWSAEWLENRHPVAIKFVRADSLRQASASQHANLIHSLHKEIDILRRIRAGHLLRLHRSGELNGLPVMVLEQLSGTLREALRATPRLSLVHALEWLRQIAEGLRALHNLGWRHLDLKPANLLLGSSHAGLPRLRIADFGASLPRAKTVHPLIGTPAWQSPEQFMPERRNEHGYHYRSDSRADIYALGLLFFHFVTGHITQFAAESLELHRLNPQLAAWAKRDKLDTSLQASDCRLFLEALDMKPGMLETGPMESNGTREQNAVAEKEPCTWNPHHAPSLSAQTSNPIGTQALHLLKSLLQAEPHARPQDIDEVLARIKTLRHSLAIPPSCIRAERLEMPAC